MPSHLLTAAQGQATQPPPPRLWPSPAGAASSGLIPPPGSSPGAPPPGLPGWAGSPAKAPTLALAQGSLPQNVQEPHPSCLQVLWPTPRPHLHPSSPSSAEPSCTPWPSLPWQSPPLPLYLSAAVSPQVCTPTPTFTPVLSHCAHTVPGTRSRVSCTPVQSCTLQFHAPGCSPPGPQSAAACLKSPGRGLCS